MQQGNPSRRRITGHACDWLPDPGRRQPLDNLGILAGIDDLTRLGEMPGALQFVHREVRNQSEVGTFAHHGRPAIMARGPERPGDDGAGDLVRADADPLPEEPAFPGRCGGGAVESQGDRAQHQGGGGDARVEAVCVAGELAGQFSQANGWVRVVQDPAEDRYRSR